jgi:acetyl coenzyme A synthetase (ADP forming)-like protein
VTTQGAGLPHDPRYPAHRESDVVLKDGSTIRVRPVRPEDEPQLRAFLLSLSDTSRALRFFAPVKDAFLEAEAGRESRVDYRATFGLVALAGREERIVAHAMYACVDHDRAETAYTVADDYQGRGLGTILLGHLAEVAAANGIPILEAEVLAGNHKMIEVFRQSGFPVKVRIDAGQIHATFPSQLSEEALEHFEDRERIASVNALRAFFEPVSVAVIGASRERGTIGGEIFHNLLSYSFEGPVYPVNPSAPVVQSVTAYPSLEAIPGDVTLAIVAVPAARVLEAAEQCARKKVRAMVVISAGFAETGAEGRARQAELLHICRAAGIRLVGPNCMGLINTDPAVRLAATFAPVLPAPGRIAFSSQSGALGVAIIEHARGRGLGISSFLSAGNKADISGNDLVSYWESDPRTDVILLYLESFGNPRKFSRVARRVGRSKPIAVVKSGRTKAGARATSSHTGALLASSDVTVDALFRQSGVIRTDTLEELFDVASLLAHQPLPAGTGVAIVTNAGGPAILCADACEAEGLEVPVLADASQASLREFLPSQASVGNPVDMIASATGDDYRRAIAVAAADPKVDAVVAIFIPPLAERVSEVAEAIVASARELAGRKPLLTVFMGAQGVPEALRSSDVRVPSYAFPESAARALARAVRYSAWRARPVQPSVRPDGIRSDEAAALVAAALGRGEGWLPPAEVRRLLSCYGLPVVEERTATDANDAGSIAEALGGEVAVKAVVAGILHKSDAGLVKLRLRGAAEVRAAAEEMRSRLAAQGHEPSGFLVQRMAAEGTEMIVGVVHDPHFGPVVACGAGGLLVELMGDVAVGLAPLMQADATKMVRSLKSYRLLTGFRGRPARDVAALEDALLRVSALVDDIPEIAEMDCNPIIVHQTGATIVDARVRVEHAAPPLPLAAKR